MPQVRRFPQSIGSAGLSLAMLLAVTHANAQSTGAAGDDPNASEAPTAPPSGVTAQTSPQAAAAPAAAAAPPAAEPIAAAPPQAATTRPTTQGAASELESPERDQDAPLSAMRDEAQQKPPPSTRWLLIGTGLATTGLFYAGAYGIGQIWPDAPGRHDLKYPVAGPIMDLTHTGCPANDSDCSKFQLVLRTFMISLDALGQLGGIAIMFQGAILGTASAEAPQAFPNASLRRPSNSIAVVPVPWSDGRSGGLSLMGRF